MLSAPVQFVGEPQDPVPSVRMRACQIVNHLRMVIRLPDDVGSLERINHLATQRLNDTDREVVAAARIASDNQKRVFIFDRDSTHDHPAQVSILIKSNTCCGWCVLVGHCYTLKILQLQGYTEPRGLYKWWSSPYLSVWCLQLFLLLSQLSICFYWAHNLLSAFKQDEYEKMDKIREDEEWNMLSKEEQVKVIPWFTHISDCRY